MNRFNLLNSIPLIIASCFILSLVLGIVLLWPRYQNLKELQESVSQKETEIQQQEQYFSNLSQIEEKIRKYDKELAKINSALPEDPSLPSLFNFLQKASSQSGLILKGISPFEISLLESSPNLKEIQFSFQVSGPYSSFKDFLSTLENSARLIEVENISFSSPKEGELFNFNLRVKVYSY